MAKEWDGTIDPEDLKRFMGQQETALSGYAAEILEMADRGVTMPGMDVPGIAEYLRTKEG